MLELLLAVAIVVVVAWFVTAPVRHRRPSREGEDDAAAELADLEARKQAKYRQIRDAEADRAAGKLTERDFRRLDAELRAEAVEILKKLDRLRQRRSS